MLAVPRAPRRARLRDAEPLSAEIYGAVGL